MIVTQSPSGRSLGRVMHRPVTVLLTVLAMAGAGCGAAATSARERGDAPVTVPDLTGKTLRDATCALIAVHLRWSLGSRQDAAAEPLSSCGSGSVHSSMDDIRVTVQTPTPGTRVRPGAVVILHDLCTPSRPCA